MLIMRIKGFYQIPIMPGLGKRIVFFFMHKGQNLLLVICCFALVRGMIGKILEFGVLK